MRAEVLIETDCLLVLRMMWCCMILDVAMFRCITYTKPLNSNIRHNLGKENALEDMLSRAWFGDEVAELEEE